MYKESLKNYLGELSIDKLFAFKLLFFTDHPVMSLTSLNKSLFNPKSSPNFLCNLKWKNGRHEGKLYMPAFHPPFSYPFCPEATNLPPNKKSRGILESNYFLSCN